MCVHITVHNCRTHITQNSSDNLPSYPPDNHHCSDVVYWADGARKGKLYGMGSEERGRMAGKGGKEKQESASIGL